MRIIRLLFPILFLSLSTALSAGDEIDLTTATFGGGSFWCLQHDFDNLHGVQSTTVGYTGGELLNPTYEEVETGTTGHVEALQVRFDPHLISYPQILEFYMHHIDPSRNDGQFLERGRQYRPIIFYHDSAQKEAAIEYIEELKAQKSISPILVEVFPATIFYQAEDRYQKYYQKNPIGYKYYRAFSGRETRLQELWNKKS